VLYYSFCDSGKMIRVTNITSILIFLLLLSSINLYPQKGKYRFEHLTTENGLTQNFVNCILQDNKGFLWVGTDDGLNRYDGYNFKVYKSLSGNPNSISHNEIQTIYEDKNGILWIGTFGGGLNKYDRETEIFISFKADKNKQFSISNDFITTIYEDKEGNFWIGTSGGGLNKFDRSTEQFTHHRYDSTDSKSLSNDKVFSICEDRSGNFWIGTFGGGLNKFDRTSGTFIHYKNDPQNPRSLSSDKIYKIYEDNEGIIWIGTYLSGLNKLVSFNEKDGSPEFELFISYDLFAPNSLGNNTIWSILEDKDSLLWIGTQWGLNICDKNEITKLFRIDHSDSESLNFASVYSLYEDKTGILWIGTLGGGLNKLNKNKKHLTHYKHNPFNAKSLNDNTVNCFYEVNDSTLWIGTGGGGINVMKRKIEEFTGYKYDPNQPRGMTAQIVKQIIKDRNGIIWVGTGIGFYKLINKIDDPGGPIFEKYFNDPENPSSLSHNSISSICEDNTGTFWIGTANGISKLFPEEQTKSSPNFFNYKYNPEDSTTISDNSINQIFEDKSGVIWIATNRGGLNKYNRDNDRFVHYKHDPNNLQSLGSDLVLSIYEDNTAQMWLGTGDGINKFNRATKEFTRYSKGAGLVGDIVYGILEDNNGMLWLSTNKGTSRFDPINESFKNYDGKDGLQKGEFRRGAYLKLNSGEFLFGGLNGFNLFHPDSIKENTYTPSIVITDFQLNNISVPVGYDSSLNRSILNYSITETKELELNYDDKVMSFEFASLDFHIPEKNLYAYILEGFEDNWTYADASRRYATFTNLDPGEYIFRVKGSNNDGYWNDTGASIKIIILPPWWETTWAYIIYALIILSIIYFTWKSQLKRIRIKNDYEMSKFEAEKLLEVDGMKSRFFANISHEFRTPLTLIFGPAKDIVEETNESKTKQNAGLIKRNASKLYGLVNQLLDLSKLEAGRMKLEASEQNIMPLLKGLVLSFTSLAERRKITLSFNTIEEKLNVFIDKAKVEKIINNLLSNAFKFTPDGGSIEFTVEKMVEEAEVRISDNGVGIPKDRILKIFDRFYQVDGSHTRKSEGTGIGLALTKELVELHKGKIRVESKEGEGTTLTILLPLGKDHLKPEEIVEEDIHEETSEAMDETEFISEADDRKEKIDIDLLLDTDKPLLLIVEDNSDVRKYIISHLEEEYRIQEAVDGEDGLEQALDHIPDLIISDVMMPNMDGFELCNKLKIDQKTSHIPIVMLTAKATSQDKIEGYETGADDYIMKPFDAAELKVRIKNLIEIRRKLQEKFSSDDFVIPKELSSIDAEFIKRVLQVINRHMSEEEFSIEEFIHNEQGTDSS